MASNPWVDSAINAIIPLPGASNWYNTINDWASGLGKSKTPTPVSPTYPQSSSDYGYDTWTSPGYSPPTSQNYDPYAATSAPTGQTSTRQTTQSRQQVQQRASAPDYSLQIAQMNAELQRQQMAQQAAQAAAQLAWDKEQARLELEAEKQRQLAQLAAQPKSWLEYAALAGQSPVVQQWMKPLMPQQYADLEVGAPIPGWNATQNTAQSGGSLSPDWNMMGMPDLSRPSAQYLARIGPTAKEQYLGYMQADTGAPFGEQDYRLWSTAPPGSQTYKPLSYQR
jgi:hypothetical protein